MGSFIDYLFDLILRAREEIRGAVHVTPLSYSYSFSKITQASVFLKLENLQKTGAFKVRGAYFKIKSELSRARERGVIAASSGNHAQGVAYASQELGVKALIVMPETTPPYKILATKSYGAEVMLYGMIYDDAYRKAVELSEERGYLFIHPFNDPYIIAGQGTIGLEVASELKDVDYVLVPVGGGGLISGIAVAVKKVLGGRVKVIGVEPEAAPKAREALRHGGPVEIRPASSLADGVVTKKVGDLTYKVMEELVDDIVTVDEDNIARAMYLLLERAKMLAEGAGALPLALLLSGKMDFKGKRVVAVISGGNADLTTLYKVILRGLTAEGRLIKFKLVLEDRPGTLRQALSFLSKYRCNIVDIKHDRFSISIKPGHALVEIIAEVPSRDIASKVIEELRKHGMEVQE